MVKNRLASLGRVSAVARNVGAGALFLCCLGSAMAAQDGLTAQADKLMKSGKAKEAYALLNPSQSERAGDPDYDYLLGIAALDSGLANEAVFALERVLAVNPNHLQARVEIARAYFVSGEVAASKQEFETVKQQNPPKEVNATIEKFLDAIERARAGAKTTMMAYLEATIGADSNVNSATASKEIAIPAFGGAIVTLSSNSVKLRDSFISIAGGFGVRHPINPEWALFGGAGFSQRYNSSQDLFDTGVLDGNLGVSLNRGGDNYSVALQLQTFDVDNTRFRDATGATAQWLGNLDSSSQVIAYLQYANLHYPGQDMRDADRYVVGAAYAHTLGGAYQPAFYVGAYGGQEREQKQDVPYLGHELYGVRLGGELKLNPLITLFGSVNGESRSYGGQDPLFLVGRRDMQTHVRMGVAYNPDKNWSVTPQFSYTRNDSNIIINDYDRTVFSVSLRHNFN